MTNLERVAKAMWEKSREGTLRGSNGEVFLIDPEILHPRSNWDRPEIRGHWMALAESCIEALREPSEAMLEAVDCGGEKRSWLSGKAWIQGWQNMIDAAKE